MQKFRLFVNNYFSIWVLGILYNKLLLKCEFNQAHKLELLKSIHTKFILKFFDIPISFYEFWKFERFSRN
jgi:hypothetical protein